MLYNVYIRGELVGQIWSDPWGPRPCAKDENIYLLAVRVPMSEPDATPQIYGVIMYSRGAAAKEPK